MLWFPLQRKKVHKRIRQQSDGVRRPRTVRLTVEPLESRLTPAPLPVDAAHSLLSQLAAATPGATLQIEPGATIGNLGAFSATLNSAAAAGDTTVSVSQFFAVGQVINITTGANVDNALVDAVAVSNGNVTLTLHSPLQFSHNSGDAVAALANVIGIGKGITIQGDPAHAASGLLSGFTLDYFPQNGTPAADALHNLMLSNVMGGTNGSLSITGDQFNSSQGSADAVSVLTSGILTISSDTFTIGASATLQTVIAAGTGGSAMTFANNTISVNGSLGSTGVILSSGSGPISISNDTLKVVGAVAGNGLSLTTGGDISVNGATVNIGGAVAKAGMEVKGADCNLSNVAVTVGGAVAGDGLAISAQGDVVVSGTNNVAITGVVAGDAVDITAGGSANVSGMTIGLKNSVGGDGLLIAPKGAITLANASVTVVGNVTGSGIDLHSGIETSAAISLDNVSTILQGTAGAGLAADAGGNLSVSGTASVTVLGAVAADGLDLVSGDGDIFISANITVGLSSTAAYGLDISADNGNVDITGAVQVQAGGALSVDGAYISGGSLTAVEAVSVTLGGTAQYGLYLQGATLDANAALTVKVTGALTNDGAYVYASSGDLTVAGPINVALESDADNGLYLSSNQGNLTDTGSIKVTMGGDATVAGAFIEGGADTMLSSTVNVTVSGAAQDGLYLASNNAALTDTAGITVNVTGAIPLEGAAAYLVGYTTATLAKLNVTAGGLGDGTGLYAETDLGLLNISTVTVTAKGGTSQADGAYLYCDHGPVSASRFGITMTGQTDYGLYVDARNAGASVSGVTVNVSGAVTDDGIYVSGGAAVSVSALTTTLKSNAGTGMDLEGNGLTVNGALTATLGGAVNNAGIYLNSSDANVVDNGPITVKVAGDAYSGLYITAQAHATLAGNIAVNIGGAASYGLYADTSAGPISNTGSITVSVAGAVADQGAYFHAATQDTLANINVTLLQGSAADGAYVYAGSGNLDLTNMTVTVTGEVDEGLYLNSASADIATSNINVTLTSTNTSSAYGLYADATSGTLNMTKTTVLVNGNLAYAAAQVHGASGAQINTAKVTVKGGSNYGVFAGGGVGDLNVNGLTLQAGPVRVGALFSSPSGSVNVTSSNITLGSTATDGMQVLASAGDITLNKVGLKETGAASDAGFNLAAQGDIKVSGSSIALDGGFAAAGLLADSVGGDLTISQDKVLGKTTTGFGIAPMAGGSLTLTGTVVALTGGGTAVSLTAASGDPAILENDTFATGSAGTGLAVTGGGNDVVLVQACNFQGNQVGVQVTGDGTSAGDIDLGGGDLGSTGGNNFSGFNGVHGHYAIVLTATNSTSKVSALHNTFSVGNAGTVIQDGSHNTSGVGTGTIRF